MYKGFWLLVIIFFLVATSCSTSYKPGKLLYTQYNITQTSAADSSMSVLLKPYRDSVNKTMDSVIGFVSESLQKKMPESTLGYLMTDAFLFEATEKFKMHVDAAFMNYGGIRLEEISKGPLTIGKVYEIMPFENLLVVQKIKGDVLQQLLDHISAKGGWPVSGIQYRIKNKKAIEIMIQGRPLDNSAFYTIVNSDYIANGGDNCEMLRNIPKENIGYLMRDALIEYFSSFKLKGENITIKSEKRVMNVE